MDNKLTIQGAPLPNMPWENRPESCNDVLWRFSANPVIPRDLLPDSNSIFNSAVVPFKDGYAGVFRVDDKNRRMTLHVGFSKDGLKWDMNPDTIKFVGAAPEVAEWGYGYDPRVAEIDGRYYVSWCNDHHGPTIGLARKSMVVLPCFLVLPTRDTLLSVTFSIANLPISNFGDVIVT